MLNLIPYYQSLMKSKNSSQNAFNTRKIYYKSISSWIACYVLFMNEMFNDFTISGNFIFKLVFYFWAILLPYLLYISIWNHWLDWTPGVYILWLGVPSLLQNTCGYKKKYLTLFTKIIIKYYDNYYCYINISINRCFIFLCEMTLMIIIIENN